MLFSISLTRNSIIPADSHISDLCCMCLLFNILTFGLQQRREHHSFSGEQSRTEKVFIGRDRKELIIQKLEAE